MKNAAGILKRHPENPILTPAHVDNAMAVFNPSPVMYEGKTLLVLSVYKFGPNIPVGGYIAESDDGVHFTVREKPFIDLRNAVYPFNLVKDPLIDNRITRIEDIYYLVTPVDLEPGAPQALLGCTKDFQTYEPLEIISLAPNRGISLFPEKIRGKYYRLDRPGAGNVPASIWLASSPDLIHWGCHRPLLQPGYAFWNQVKIGPTPPIKTSAGWLVITHAVWSWGNSDYHYYIAAMLLDLDNPERVIGKTTSWLLAPEKEYEVHGTVNDVVFPCGALADLEKDELRLYYGAADTNVGLASGLLSAVIEACQKEL
jgi:predicted GH43/DUF377 family glycosyl hydrolase